MHKMHHGDITRVESEHESLSIRKIDNGYVLTKTETGSGQYKSTEIFSKARPRITGGTGGGAVGTETLGLAMDYLKKGGE